MNTVQNLKNWGELLGNIKKASDRIDFGTGDNNEMQFRKYNLAPLQCTKSYYCSW